MVAAIIAAWESGDGPTRVEAWRRGRDAIAALIERQALLADRARGRAPRFRLAARGALDQLTADLRERYRVDQPLFYDAYRRPNVPNPLPAMAWASGPNPQNRSTRPGPRMADPLS